MQQMTGQSDNTTTGSGERPSGTVETVCRLIVVASPDPEAVGHSVTLSTQRVEIGRDPASGGLRLAEGRVSRRHAGVRTPADSGQLEVTDLDSKNGTFLNGERVVGTAATSDGGVLRLGDSVLVFESAARRDWAAHASDASVWAESLVGLSTALEGVRRELLLAAAAGGAILITGESGTGKELAARLVHAASGRPGPLVVVNCGTITPELAPAALLGHRRGAFTGATSDAVGLFAAADGGTLFLDEIGSLPLASQPSLLRVLEDGLVTPVGSIRARRVDVRVVCATNTDLRAAASRRAFRGDLLARLAAWHIRIPPLRSRRADVAPIARHLVPNRVALDADVSEALTLTDWPDNVRGLAAAVHRAVARASGPAVRLNDLDDELTQKHRRAAGPGRVARPAPSADELLEVARRLEGNVLRIARHFDRPRKQIYRWVHRYGLDLDAVRRPDG